MNKHHLDTSWPSRTACLLRRVPACVLVPVWLILALGVVIEAWAQGACEGHPSELVLMNGTMLTMDADDSVVSAVRIVEGRFVAVGEVGSTEGVCVIDLGGRTVTPGLIDSHIHYFRDAHVPGHLLSAIETVFTIPDLLAALAERTASVPVGEFITAFAHFNPSQFAENRLPTLEELDSVTPNHPVYLHVSFNGPAVTNTLGKASFESQGVTVNASGTFSAQQTGPPVQALYNDYTNEEALRTVGEYMLFSASLGLTTIQNFFRVWLRRATPVGCALRWPFFWTCGNKNPCVYEFARPQGARVRIRIRTGTIWSCRGRKTPWRRWGIWEEATTCSTLPPPGNLWLVVLATPVHRSQTPIFR